MKNDDFTEIPPSHFEIRAMFEGDDALGIILKGHLYVERYLALVLSGVPAMTADKVFGLPFARKIDRALQTGIIPADEAAMFRMDQRHPQPVRTRTARISLPGRC
jgi:hypothetical protein